MKRFFGALVLAATTAGAQTPGKAKVDRLVMPAPEAQSAKSS